MRLLAIIFATLVVAPPALASDQGIPWPGGAATVSALETDASSFASSIAERPVRAVCNSPAEWQRLARLGGFDSEQAWGFVVFRDGSPLDETQLSDRACLYLEFFRAAKNKEAVTISCRIATKLVYRTETVVKQVRVRVDEEWVVREVKRTVQRAKQEPVYAPCPDYGLMLSALVTLAHESVHLRGFADEGVAECFGMQLMDDAARWLGASDTLASRMAADYWTGTYTRLRPDSGYYRSDCGDGTPLDLSPTKGAWPAGGDTILPGP